MKIGYTILTFVVGVFFMSFSLNTSDNLLNMRNSFFEIKGDLDKAETIYKDGLKNKNKSVVFNAYMGTLKAMLAAKQSNPFSKLSWFNKGTSILEEAIKRDSDNPEIHFLRLSIQLNAPKFLFYYGDIEYDQAFVITNIGYFKKIGIANKVKLFLLKNGNLTTEEIKQLKSK